MPKIGEKKKVCLLTLWGKGLAHTVDKEIKGV